MEQQYPNSFGKDIIPANEQERLSAMTHYRLLNELPAGYFNGLAQIIARTFDTPIALVSLVGKDEVLFPGNMGMDGTDSAPRGVSLCSLAILSDKPTIFENSLNEPCLLANPLVTGNFGLRFYAGAPITTKDGFPIGTVCVVDKEPRTFTESEKAMLQEFAATAMIEIEKRYELIRKASS
ncbi:GAF domain-containing protein [Flaviaesturariibacter terrae]